MIRLLVVLAGRQKGTKCRLQSLYVGRNVCCAFSFCETKASAMLDLSQPHVMGVLNVTPDSFSDGGRYTDVDGALRRAAQMCREGASIIDIGGESTRPGAARVTIQEELDRTMPVIERIAKELDVCISLDSSTPEVMGEGLALGVGLVNDVRAFQRQGALDAVKESGALLCVMHMQGEPDTMQKKPSYDSVVDEVLEYISQRVAVLEAAGVERDRILVDPGFGFGKTLEHNFSLLKHLNSLGALGLPVLVGMSRKSMIGLTLDKPVEERVHGSVAAALLALERGATILRVHDVAPTADAVKIWQSMCLVR